MKSLLWLSLLSLFFEDAVNAAANAIIGCPEQLGGHKQSCLNEGCGGNDANNAGLCSKQAVDGSHCLCKPSSVYAMNGI
jgi:hypothetical protein